jgi:hypothetical protein
MRLAMAVVHCDKVTKVLDIRQKNLCFRNQAIKPLPDLRPLSQADFHARTGGKRSAEGIFDFVKVEGNWWSSTEYSTLNGSYLNILFN